MTLGQRLDDFFTKRPPEYFGIVGCAIIAITSVITAIGYTGAMDESYSILNHFISELGFVRDSELAWVFNIGLIVGAPIVGVFLVGTRVTIPSRTGALGRIVGLITAVGGALVGVFPADLNIIGHIIAAMSFFVGGCLTVGILSIAILRQKEVRVSKWLSAAGAAVMVSFALFLAIGFQAPAGQESDYAQMMQMMFVSRPDFLLAALLEWIPLLGVLTWICLTALDSLLRRKRQVKN